MKEAQSILASLDRAAQTARQAGCGADMPLRLGITGDIVTTRLMTVLSCFHRISSIGQATVSDADEAHHRWMLNNGMLDLILLPAIVAAGYTVSAPLWSEELHVALPIAHPLAGFSSINLDFLTDSPLILSSGDHLNAPNQILLEACRRTNIRISIAGTAHRLEVRLMLVAAGLGFTILPASSMILTITAGIVSRPLQPPLRMMVAAAWQPSNPTPEVQRFLNLARSMDVNTPPP